MSKKCYVGVDGVARKIKQPYIGMGTYNLTEKFIEAPYLITDGSNYVDTAITIDASYIHRMRIVMDLKFVNDKVNNGIGVSIYSDGNINVFNISTYMGQLYFGNGTADIATGWMCDGRRHIYDLNPRENYFKVDEGATVNMTDVTFNDPNVSDVFKLPAWGSGIELYRCQIYIDGSIIRDYVPVKEVASGVNYAMSLNNGVWFGPSGSGNPFTSKNPVQNLFNPNGVMDVDYTGGIRSDLITKNTNRTVTIRSNYNHLVYGQDLFGVVKAGKTYTFSVDVVDASVSSVHLCIDCMKDGARYIDFVGAMAVSAGQRLARTFVIPDGCTSVVFGLANASSDSSSYIVVENIQVVEGAYTSDTIPPAIFQSARKVKKGYIGVGDVARPWMVGEPTNWGTATPIAQARTRLAATTIGNYALFGGGSKNTSNDTISSDPVSDVDTYDKNLTKGTAIALSEEKQDLAATSVGNYALFAGGYKNGSYSAVVDAYSDSLVKTLPTKTNTSSRRKLTATTINDYAIFVNCSGVDTYDKNLTHNTLADITSALYIFNNASTTVGNYAIFAGGMYINDSNKNDYTNLVVAYNNNLVKSVLTTLSQERGLLAGASVGNYALFAGGLSDGTPSEVVDAYSKDLVRITPTALSVNKQELVGVSADGFAFFAGGINYAGRKEIEVYDENLVKANKMTLSVARGALAAANIGDYVIFSGGHSVQTVYDTVDVCIV